MKLLSIFLLVLLVNVACVVSQKTTTAINTNGNLDQTTHSLSNSDSIDQSDKLAGEQLTTANHNEQKYTTNASSNLYGENSDTQSNTTSLSESSSQNSSLTTHQAQTTQVQDEDTTSATATTEVADCRKKSEFCFEHKDCCDSLKCNMIYCAPCVTERHGCDDDSDCCKGLKCVEATSYDNNKYFRHFIPMANKFNPSKQCLGKKKKTKFSRGFDWTKYVPVF